jgi:mycofactocin precursor
MLTETGNVVATPTADSAMPQAECRTPTPSPVAPNEGGSADGKPRILEEVVIEEVSIDGMCGVY